MNSQTLIYTTILALLPISELRGAIPYALANGAPLILAFSVCVVLNALVGPLVFIFLSTFNKLFLKMRWYENLFNKVIENARIKVKEKVDKFGYIGILFFVAIPLPITGAYTGTLGAWVLGMEPKKTFLAVAAGVFLAGIIVSIVSVLGIEAFSFFIKHVS